MLPSKARMRRRRPEWVRMEFCTPWPFRYLLRLHESSEKVDGTQAASAGPNGPSPRSSTTASAAVPLLNRTLTLRSATGTGLSASVPGGLWNVPSPSFNKMELPLSGSGLPSRLRSAMADIPEQDATVRGVFNLAVTSVGIKPVVDRVCPASCFFSEPKTSLLQRH